MLSLAVVEFACLVAWPALTHADEYHVVAAGPCVAEGDAYCIRRVTNSVCSATKNECFCQPSFVAIQEEYGITCKPLLTSLSCHVDRDCVHVRNSICHPGAGFCACPGGTIYVPQAHACRNLADKENSTFCETCRQVNGVCYYEEQPGGSNNRNSSSPGLGCTCPFDTAMPSPSPDAASKEPVPHWAFCKAILVDIGGLCNQIDLLCRPRNSECTSVGGSLRSCRCQKGYFPVYQQSLHYHECFRSVPCVTKGSGDLCVDINGDGTADEHVCETKGSTASSSPPFHASTHNTPQGSKNLVHYSHDWPALNVILEKEAEATGFAETPPSNQCPRPMVHVSCTLNRLMACFLPPTRPPYQQLHQSLIDGSAVAYLTGQGRSSPVTPHLCILRPNEDGFLLNPSSWETANHHQFCVNLEFTDNQSRLPCGITLTRNETVVVVKAVLEVRTDARVWQSTLDMRFDLTCRVFTKTAMKGSSTAPFSSRRRQPSFVRQEGSWSKRQSDQWNVDNIRPTPSAFDLSFVVVSDAKRVVSRVLLASPIQLKATLFDPTGTFTTFVVESCHATLGSNADLMYVNIINRGCPNTASGFSGSFLTYALSQRGREHDLSAPSINLSRTPPSAASSSSSLISIISSQFPAFIISKEHRYHHQHYNAEGTNRNVSFRINSSSFQGNASSVRVTFTCGFRLCAVRAWCAFERPCSRDPEKNTTFLPPKVHFAVRSLTLEVANPTPRDLDTLNSHGTQGCSSVFCQPRIQLLLIMASLGAMLCLSMICGCLVSRNHHLFRPKSATSSLSLPNLTFCGPHSAFLAARHSVNSSKPSSSGPPQFMTTCSEDVSISTAFLHHEPEHNYIQFTNPPPLPSISAACLHDPHQSLPRTRQLQYHQAVISSAQIDNRSGLMYANGNANDANPTFLIPMSSNHHRRNHLRGKTEWIWEGGEAVGHTPTSICSTTSPAFAITPTAAVQKNNHVAPVDSSPKPRRGCSVLENRPLCLIPATAAVNSMPTSPAQSPSPVVTPEALYRLPSKLYMMPEFSYCVAASNDGALLQ